MDEFSHNLLDLPLSEIPNSVLFDVDWDWSWTSDDPLVNPNPLPDDPPVNPIPLPDSPSTTLQIHDYVPYDDGWDWNWIVDNPPVNPIQKQDDDGYKWKETGRVKGGEYPKKYYVCNNEDCLVKKKVKLSQDGHITCVFYEGKHDHPKPLLLSTYAASSSRSGRNPDPVGNDESDRQLIRFKDELDENEDIIRVATVSDTDIIDDGFEWRMYGQKFIKNSSNPRRYFRCKTASCPVRKHVERAPYDIKFVLTTYAKKHNHFLPVAGRRPRPSGGCLRRRNPPTQPPT